MPIGPSTTTSPYLIASQGNVTFFSIATVGDIIGVKPGGAPRPMVGVPDGIGAFDNGDGTVTLLFNHELGATTGAVREHGSQGAFVDRVVINKTTLQVLSSEDLIKQVFLDPDGDGVYALGTTAFERFCSSDLAAPSAFFNAATGLGATERIYLTGEETGPPFTADFGRAFAVLVTGPDAGKAFELPALGNMSFENQVASPASGDKTVIVEMDDSSPTGQVYIYVGNKQASGNAIEKAGLTNGNLYGIKVAGLTVEANSTQLTGDQATFTLQLLANAKTESGAQLQADSAASGVTEFLRPEDGAWDPSHPNWFYFNTTASFDGHSRLWRLEFNDVNDPTAGGTIRMMLDGTEGQRMLDNMTITADGKVILLEDVGNNAFLGRVLLYDPATDTLTQLGIHDPARFLSGGANFITQDEEASGVIDVTSIFGTSTESVFLLDTQAHNLLGGELVEGGQMQLMRVSNLSSFSPSELASVTYQKMYGLAPTVAELNTLASFAAEQYNYGFKIGVIDPSLYAFQSTGLVLAEQAATGSNAFASKWGPSAIQSDQSFVSQAYADVFSLVAGSAVIELFLKQLNFFESLYTGSGAFGIDANRIDLLARGAVYGQMLGVQDELAGVPLVGIGAPDPTQLTV